MKKFIFENSRTFAIYLAIVVSLFLMASYNYLLNNYKMLESSNNNKYINYLITKIDYNAQLENKTIKNIKTVDNSYQYLLNSSSIINFFDTIEYLYKKTSFNDNNNFQSKIFLISVDTTKSNHIINNIHFFDIKKNYLFSIKTINQRDIISTGENAILIFILLCIIFLLVLFIMTKKYLSAIQCNNEILEKKVETRTEQIQSALVELEKANLRLYDMAHTDSLTKIRNRRNFFMHSENYFESAKRKNKDLTVILMDIDNFKKFNDKYGHDIGDRVLIEFSQCIDKLLDKRDIFGRLGGEEFAISLFNTNLYTAIEKAEFIRKKLKDVYIDLENERLSVTASFGVSDIRGCKSIDEMIQKADRLLYSAKHSGKNRVRSRLSSFN